MCGPLPCAGQHLGCCNDSIEQMEVCFSRDTDWCAYGKYLCALNNDVCAGWCINPVDAVCINATIGDPASGTLCGRGLGLCGTTCYDQVHYTCEYGLLQARLLAATQLLCENTPFDPSNSTCCQAIGNNSQTAVCLQNELCCSSGAGDVTCFDPNEKYCCTERDGKICSLDDYNCCYGN